MLHHGREVHLLIEKEGLQGGKGDNKWVGRHRPIHDPGIQQEPFLYHLKIDYHGEKAHVNRTTHYANVTQPSDPVVAFALREKPGSSAAPPGHGHKPRRRSMPARDHERVLDEIAQAKRRVGRRNGPVVML